MQKQDVIKEILKQFTGVKSSVTLPAAYAWAPANLALCKYWGKRDEELNLPMTSSLSISLGNRGTFTRISYVAAGVGDIYVVNGKEVAAGSEFAKRLRAFLDLFRPNKQAFYLVETESTVPIAAGLASSASGYAALVLALNKFYNWNLAKKELSVLARLGSGSACRSLWSGFVEWYRGERSDGMDCYAAPLTLGWPELRIGTLIFSHQAKKISSRQAMAQTVATSKFYPMWPCQVEVDLQKIHQAISTQDFVLLGSTAEHNSLAMHALMQSTLPPIIYSNSDTIAAMQRVWELRHAGIEVFFTQDAGANLQLLFLANEEHIVQSAFPELEIIRPFFDMRSEQLILVDETDREIGVGEKLPVHVNGQLHRAFSVVLWRRHNGNIEVLLQQRSKHKYHSANLWSNSCCGHPRPGEDVLAAAMRRLHEEMGVTMPLREVGTFLYRAELPGSGLYEHEMDHVFVGECSTQLALKPNRDEVQAFSWMTIDRLLADLNENSQQYTVWLPQVMAFFLSTK